ncbi:DUF1320 domain-containing protein [Capnocytophaga catalasegens]|uniref:DUF1320 domain-containing protein n=1 Tax=Capnocytophaga catalasegens TaxID=1004260 RepID=A0AAV5AX20_9FLAO|nr:DUF1320 domain-containing protein [Capnocytophaga catalasegens]GIZ15295.1 hypothetical protein RCZ03_12950 [Capnocytophaga catalasegens]GJM51229.1 hypothetical protein RCZ15_22020 [Capnocytophaga catalasegens]GJM53023.1 hypothetical protein RCZ16_13400 [Capnocytophaga catalasegens]
MFATKDDLKNNIYNYQTDQITEGDDTIVLQALETAEQEVRSYLEFNDRLEYLDGRPHYDTDKIFSARDTNRNPLILNLVITVAKWHIIDLANVDILYDRAKERYDRAIDYLKRLSKGEVTISSLPLVNKEDLPAEALRAFRFGSRPKFNHEG